METTTEFEKECSKTAAHVSPIPKKYQLDYDVL